MASKAKLGAGDQVQIGDGASPEVFLTVPEAKSIDFGGIEVGTEEVTNQDSPVVNGLLFKEYIAGLADGKELSVECNYLPGDVNQAKVASYQDGKTHNIKILIRDITASPVSTLATITFAAFITTWAPKTDVGKARSLSLKFKVTGAVTIS